MNASTSESMSAHGDAVLDAFYADGTQDASDFAQTTFEGSFDALPLTDIMRFNKHLATLNREQRYFVAFLNEWYRQNCPNGVYIVSGGPGTGKTHVVIKTLEFIQDSILKMAYTNKVANAIGGRTLHSVLGINFISTQRDSFEDIVQRVESGEETYKGAAKKLMACFRSRGGFICPSITVIDEIGMVPVFFLAAIVKYIGDGLFILMGDQHQLKPVRCKDNVFSMSHLLELPSRQMSLVQNNRFTQEYHAVIDALRGYINERNTEAVMALIGDAFPIRTRLTEADMSFVNLVLTYKNEKVAQYNHMYLNTFQTPFIHIPAVVKGVPDLGNILELKRNCSVTVTGRNKRAGNDYLVYAYLPTLDKVQMTDGTLIGREGAQFPLTLNYSCTIHKYQGQTINQHGIVFDFDQNQDLHFIYTALSRVRNVSQIYAVLL